MRISDREYQLQQKAISTFSSRVYGWMTLGLATTAVVALFWYTSGLFVTLFSLWWVWCFATLGVSLWINARIDQLTVTGIIGLFLTYSVLEGLFFGTVLPVYAASYGGGVIWAAFLTGASIFGAAALYGTLTKNDLTSWGRILSLGLIGLIAVSLMFFIISFFIPMPFMYLLICYLGLILFVALSAYDAQTIKKLSLQADVSSTISYKMSMIMALKMYLNVIMIFWYLLQIFGSGNKK